MLAKPLRQNPTYTDEVVSRPLRLLRALGADRHRAARDGYVLRQRRLEAMTLDRSRLGPFGSLSAEFHPVRLEGEVDATLAMTYKKSE